MIVLLDLSSKKFSIRIHKSNSKGNLTMKVIVRSLVIALALTGAIATTCANASSAKATVSVAKTSAAPVPTCPPDDPNGCGIYDGN